MILDVLGYQFPFGDRADPERKIKPRLRDHDLGPCRQERLDRLRRFKDAIQSEIHRGARSGYFAGRHGR